SRGPTADGRAKPDLVAPGVHIAGPATQIAAYTGQGVCNKFYPSGQLSYTWSSGTSHATPLAAGVASLLDHHYTRALAPGQVASPAMLKALLINASRYLSGTASGGTLPGGGQGWGGVNLAPILDPSTARILIDQTRVFTQTGQSFVQLAQIVSATQPTRITLVWTDPPGSPFAGKQLVNDLDLEVVVNGQTYRGNVFAGAFSIPGGAPDDRNTVEQVVLPAGITGALRVRVLARNLAGQAIMERSDLTNQDFALVVSNAQALPTPELQIVAHEGADPSGSPFALAGSRHDITVTVANVGSGPATAVSATLAVITGPASVLTGSAPLPPVGAGMTATTVTPLALAIDAAAQCLDRAQIRVSVTYDDVGLV
ncbi:MAG: S8 family serine peptidase, partial [Dehalococcoidia bacterium]|nr:S8 family serine peptidase [Dehalococcoidia bacterium]